MDDYDQFYEYFDLDLWVDEQVIKAFPTLRQLIVFTLATCSQVRYVIDTTEDEGRKVVETDYDFEGPWSFGHDYYVEEVPNEPICLFDPSLSTSRTTILGIGPADGRLAASFFESVYSGLREGRVIRY